ncbi:TetR/AcrR family transcriptional regulator [Nitrospirillum pindoramense]|uniref:TetR family transcriptional regulator n=1 Tax=Nitrospirillum amazonense TaxID=28077 RepID=A0A560GU20_9PROT|nr:TetR/AcrR family transcriptional regulator [Nitrospirillum amazonense]TWB37532.1 TetR family transcriptional regulator [Nitrospirillum amazonense]
MARPKLFTRDAVLDKAIPLFWRHGYAGTNVQQLEQATGVNKSGLYAEFTGKEDLFLAALQRYLDTGPALRLLAREPLGWANIEKFLTEAPFILESQPGCLVVNATGALGALPDAAADLIRSYNARRLDSLERNVAAANPALDARAVAGMIATFFLGLCSDANLGGVDLGEAVETHQSRVAPFMAMLRGL